MQPSYCVQLKQTVLAAFVYWKRYTDGCYGYVQVLRTARDKQKLNTHFNIAIIAVSVAKAAYYLSVPAEQRDGFFKADIKMLQHEPVNHKKNFLKLSC